jgi:hypothetical protein
MTVDFTNDYPFKPPVVSLDIASNPRSEDKPAHRLVARIAQVHYQDVPPEHRLGRQVSLLHLSDKMLDRITDISISYQHLYRCSED